jgi:uncharacterized protein (DUF2147 family)
MAMLMRWIAAAAALASLVAGAAAAPASVEGTWLSQEKTGIVAIAPCGNGRLCGRLVWVQIKPSDNNPRAIDNRNPAPELRSRKLCGLTMMWGFRPDGPDQWNDGALYDPESGDTYSAEMSLRPDGTLSLRGYVLVSLFGRSEVWTRFTQPLPHCPAQ